MALPSPDEVKSWGGKLVVDRAGLPIGSVTQVYTDDDTGLPEWATIKLGEATIFLPLLDAVEQDGRVRVVVRRDDIEKAPMVLDRHHITPDEEVRLLRYYGIPYTPRPSGNVLPAGEGPPPRPEGIAARLRAAPPVALTVAVAVGSGHGRRDTAGGAPAADPAQWPDRRVEAGRSARRRGALVPRLRWCSRPPLSRCSPRCSASPWCGRVGCPRRPRPCRPPSWRSPPAWCRSPPRGPSWGRCSRRWRSSRPCWCSRTSPTPRASSGTPAPWRRGSAAARRCGCSAPSSPWPPSSPPHSASTPPSSS